MSRGAIYLVLAAALLVLSLTGAGWYLKNNTEQALNEVARQLEAEATKARLDADPNKVSHRKNNTIKNQFAENSQSQPIKNNYKSLAKGANNENMTGSLRQRRNSQPYDNSKNNNKNLEETINSVQSKSDNENTFKAPGDRTNSMSNSNGNDNDNGGYVSRPSSLTAEKTNSAISPQRTDKISAKKYVSDDYEKKRQATISRLNVLAPENSSVVRTLQVELKRLGCYRGEIDGLWGQLSENALISFKKSTGAKIHTSAPTLGAVEAAINQRKKVCWQSKASNAKNVRSVQNYDTKEHKLEIFRRCLTQCRIRNSDELSRCMAAC